MAKRAPQTHRWFILLDGSLDEIWGTSSSYQGAQGAMNSHFTKIRRWGNKPIVRMGVEEIV